MKSILNTEKLNQILGDYHSGKAADCIKDPDILRQVRMRHRQLGHMMTGLDRDKKNTLFPLGLFYQPKN